MTDITARTHLTQGAISQSVALLEAQGIVARHALDDGRKSGIQLTPSGRALVARLESHWLATFAAISSLEQEIGRPLLSTLEKAAQALERQGFAARITAVKDSQPSKEPTDAE